MITAMALSLVAMAMVSVDMEVGPWRAVNDGVMGGVSSGAMARTDTGLRFTGELSLENNGGFASVRRLMSDDLSGATGVQFEVRGDGRDYQFRIRLDNRFDGVAWSADFATSGDWQTVAFSLGDFRPVFRGYAVPEAGPVIASKIGQIGFLIADKTEGEFALDIRSIRFTSD